VIGSPPREASERRGDAVRLARRLARDADAAALSLRRQSAAQAALAREAAEREAEQVWRQAAVHAAAIREAAEREAQELRAIVASTLSAAGSGVAGLAPPARPAALPPRRPVTQPASRPSTRRPSTRRPSTGRPGTRGRQSRAMRKMTAALAVMLLFGATTGAVELNLHGLSFFLFRNSGAGAGNSQNLTENQGPGQPDAPRPHPRVHQPARYPAKKEVRHGQPG
jgi:hypothetical protein